MSKKETLTKALENLGYSPKEDEDGDLFFRYQLKNMCVIVGEEDDNYVLLYYPQFHELEEGEEKLALTVCNKLTRDFKIVKVYIDQTLKNISASYEFFYFNEESLEQNLDRGLSILGVVHNMYGRTMAEFTKE